MAFITPNPGVLHAFLQPDAGPSLAVTLPWKAESPHFTEGESEAESREQAS